MKKYGFPPRNCGVSVTEAAAKPTDRIGCSRRLSADMGIEQGDFVKAFILALSDDRVARKLQDAICGQLTKEVCELRDIVKSRDVEVKELKTEIDEMKAILDVHEQYSRRNSLRISGVIEDANEDIVAVTLGFINKELGMATPIVERDIDRVHRLGPPTRDQSLLSLRHTALVNWYSNKRHT